MIVNKLESHKLKEDKVEKYFKLCRDIQINCCICIHHFL